MKMIEISPTIGAHITGLQTVVSETALLPAEMLPEMIAGFLAGNGEDLWLTCLVDGIAVGLCYARPEPLTNGTWNMLALAVRPDCQGHGLGSRLVEALEQALGANRQRLLIVDTSGTEAFAATRNFYLKAGYKEEARIRDYWDAGDDKITFRKEL